MKRTLPLWLSLAALALWGCGREFAPPPPQVQITAIDPAKGFMGDRVTVSGKLFESQAANNLVFFGSTAADVDAAVSSPADGRLVVVVPRLEADQRYDIKVSTATGQATYPSALEESTDGGVSEDKRFHYLGSGHPVVEEVTAPLPLRAGPLALTPLETRNLPALKGLPVLVANQASRMLSLVQSSGQHIDFGTGDIPLSVAVRSLTVSADTLSVRILVVTMADGLQTTLREMAIDGGLDQLSGTDRITQVDTSIIELSKPDGNPLDLLPQQVWTFCLQGTSGNCQDTLVVVSDLFRPRFALHHYGSDGAPVGNWELVVLNPDLMCDMANPGSVLDVVYWQGGNQLLVTAMQIPEILKVTLPASGDQAVVEVLYDENSCPPRASFTALALYPSRGNQTATLYATAVDQAETGQAGRLLRFVLQVNQPAPVPSSTSMEDTPFTLALASLFASDGTLVKQRLYLGTGRGLLVADPTDLQNPNLASLKATLLPTGNLYGISQGLLVTQDQDGPHQVLLALPDQDELLQADVFNEETSQTRLSMSILAPQVVPSGFADLLYIASPMSNVVQILDQNSGLQGEQFPVRDAKAFGTMNVATIFKDGADLFFSPMPDSDLVNSKDPAKYLDVVVRVIDGAKDIRALVYDWRNLESAGDPSQISRNKMDGETMAEHFQEMLPAPRTPALYLVRYGDTMAKTQGKIWAATLATQLTGAGMTIVTGTRDNPDDTSGSVDLDPMVVRARLSQDEQVLATFAPGMGDSKGAGTVAVMALQDGVLQWSSTEPAPFGYFFSDLAVRHTALGSTVYVAHGDLQEIIAVGESGDSDTVGSVRIATLGRPSRLFFSPDGRRLYATHANEGRVSVIDTDCPASDTCNRVLRTLEVQDLPNEVIFHSTGERAFVSHLTGNQISVIE